MLLCHTRRVSTKLIEQQLTELQTRVALLEALIKPPSRGWKAIIGTSKGQALDREAAKLGAQWRTKLNKRK